MGFSTGIIVQISYDCIHCNSCSHPVLILMMLEMLMLVCLVMSSSMSKNSLAPRPIQIQFLDPVG